MNTDQTLILAILAGMAAMFLWGRWRHDMVAVGALLACVILGLVAPNAAFTGFGHPAVITVACVLVLSQGLQRSGAVDVLARTVLPAAAGPTLSIAALTALAALLSGFMNNVGALALLMPVAITLAARLGLPPGKVLMPLAFASILGGTTTLIGTPPNLIVSGFRSEAGLGGFSMFAYSPVGLGVTAAGVLFIALIGWRLVPARKHGGFEGFDSSSYITEARIPEGSKAAGMNLGDIERSLDKSDAQLLGLVRNDLRVYAPRQGRRVRAGDILILEAEAESLAKALAGLGLELEEARQETKGSAAEAEAPAEIPAGAPPTTPGESAYENNADADPHGAAKDLDDITLIELAVLPGAALAGRSASDILLRTRYGINLLAVSRHGQRSIARLRAMAIEPGDLILLQGAPEALAEFAANFGCVPLAERDVYIPDRSKTIHAAGIMTAAVASAAFGLVPAAVSFAAAVLASMAFRTVPPRTVYDAVDWPVVVLLAALLPISGAMQDSGTAGLIAHHLLIHIAPDDAVIGLAVVLVVTMLLTDLMNNAATAAVMAPIAIGVATQLDANPDTFLMAVAVGASCAFLTPIGHQNNTLIMGPGGFGFGDYWRVGLILNLLVLGVSLPLLLLVWPL
jgi:di/tricarboxylate transporter